MKETLELILTYIVLLPPEQGFDVIVLPRSRDNGVSVFAPSIPISNFDIEKFPSYAHSPDDEAKELNRIIETLKEYT